MKKVLWGVVVLAAAGGGYAYYAHRHAKPVTVAYRTARIERRPIVQEVRATGVVQPLRAIDIGTQVNGRILRLSADFNSQVREGEVIAQIDPAVYQAVLARDEASLLSSRANVVQTRTRLTLADKTLVRSKALFERQMIPEAELDQAQADRDALAAQLQMVEASVQQAEASVTQSRANLDYTTIRAPVSGVVVSRNVDEGQTVVSSMSAQKLFSMATDLSRVQVMASIPEADIGRVRAGQRVTFSVDAYETVFTGVVAQVRLASTAVQNVVTYPVIVEADNPGERLFPGMTANIACEVARCDEAVVVPNAALRFVPTVATDTAEPEAGRSSASGGSSGRRSGGGRRGGAAGPRVWRVDAKGSPEAVPVRTGLSDGYATQLVDGDELLDSEVILGVQSATAKASSVKNPFAPQLPPRGAMGGRPH